MNGGSHRSSAIGIGGASRLLPSHTTVRTGPYTAVRWIKRWRSFAPTPEALIMGPAAPASVPSSNRSEEHTSELQSLRHLVCRLLLEKKKTHNHRQQNSTDANPTQRRGTHTRA